MVKEEEGINITVPQENHDFLEKLLYLYFHKDWGWSRHKETTESTNQIRRTFQSREEFENGKAPGCNDNHAELNKNGPPIVRAKNIDLYHVILWSKRSYVFRWQWRKRLWTWKFGSSSKATKTGRRCQTLFPGYFATSTEKNTVANHNRQTWNWKTIVHITKPNSIPLWKKHGRWGMGVEMALCPCTEM